jgi:putative ABC transport system permease protein
VLVLKNLLRRKVRTLLSVLGVAIGIAAIVAFNAVGRGFRNSLDQYMHQSGAQMLVVNRTVQDPAFSRISKEEQDFIRSLPAVAHLSPVTFTMASPRGLKAKPKRMLTLLVFGRTPGDRLLEKFRGRLSGRLFESEDEVIVGADAARDLSLAAGDTLELFGQTFRVVGVYESDVKFELSGAMLSNSVVQRQLKMGESAAMAFLYLRPGSDWRDVKAAVEGRGEHLEAIQTEQFTQYYNQLEYIDWFVWIVSLVSVAVGALGVLNTMLMSVSERTREIGTLRAVGWGRDRVLRLILAEGTLISVAGGLLGLATGVAGAEILIGWAPSGLDTLYTAGLFAQAFAVAVALGLAGALYPALQASRLSPIEALKYE